MVGLEDKKWKRMYCLLLGAVRFVDEMSNDLHDTHSNECNTWK